MQININFKNNYSMKKSITFRTFTLFVLLFSALPALVAQDMLVKYTFDGGSLAPEFVAEGVVAGSLGQHGTLVTYATGTVSTRDYLSVQNATTTIGPANVLYLPIGPESGKILRIVSTVITHRKAADNTTTQNIRSFLYPELGEASSNNLIYVNYGGVPISSFTNWRTDTYQASTGGGIASPVYIDATYYASLAVNKTSTGTAAADWWIDEIAFYGEVLLESDLPLLYEGFDTKATSAMKDKDPLTNLSDYTVLSGWTTENVTEWHKSGGRGFAPALLSTVDAVASFTTPEIDLSKPFKVEIRGKKISTTDNGESYVLVDQDTIYVVEHPDMTLRPHTIDGYIATANSKITFSGKGVANNNVVFDDIIVSNTSSPTVSLPLSATKSFGVVSSGSNATIDIPVKGYNLTGDLEISTPSNGVFELLSGTTITQAAVEDEDGAVIQVKFSPLAEELYSGYIQLTDGGLGAARTIYLTGEGGITTNIDINKSQAQLRVNGSTLTVTNPGEAILDVYSMTGSLLLSKNFSNHLQVNIPQGIYIVRVRETDSTSISKIIIQ
jgi:hypothetical protein